jgi:flagellar L-ring protein FlgH
MTTATIALSLLLAQQGVATQTRSAPAARAPLPAGQTTSPADAAPTPLSAPPANDTLQTRRPTRSATARTLDAHAAAPKPLRSLGNAEPGSLFAVKDPEPRTFAVHDLVTIVVSEQSKSKSTADAKADKNWKTSAAVDAWVSLDPSALGEGFLSPLNSGELPSVGLGGDKTFKGKGSYNRADDFSARVTAEIVEVRPNGLLVLEARREIVNDGETQIIVLSGICRPEDVDTSNQVQSQRVADAVIKKTTTGQLRDTTEKGVIAKLFDAIFAF